MWNNVTPYATPISRKTKKNTAHRNVVYSSCKLLSLEFNASLIFPVLNCRNVSGNIILKIHLRLKYWALKAQISFADFVIRCDLNQKFSFSFYYYFFKNLIVWSSLGSNWKKQTSSPCRLNCYILSEKIKICTDLSPKSRATYGRAVR